MASNVSSGELNSDVPAPQGADNPAGVRNMPGGNISGRVPSFVRLRAAEDDQISPEPKRSKTTWSIQDGAGRPASFATPGGSANHGLVGFDEVSEIDESDFDDWDGPSGQSVRPNLPSGSGMFPPHIPSQTTMSGSNIALSDESMFDPMRLIEEAQEGMIEVEQREFLSKYFYDPQFLPKVLEDIEAEHPIPDILRRAVGRPLDNEILDMMQSPHNTRAKDLDKGFLSASHRLGVALGPLLELWSVGREARATGDTVDPNAVTTLLEKSMVILGQVNAALLFSRRKNLLARFFGDSKKAGDLVVRNQSAFSHDEAALFGEVFHEALYKKSQGSRHLREARREFGDRAARGRGRGRGWSA